MLITLPLLFACAHKAPAPPVLPLAPQPEPGLLAARVGDAELDALLEGGRTDDQAFARLTQLCDDIGARLSGSVALERAVDWSEALFVEDGHEGVAREPVTVPVWRRGDDRLAVVGERARDLSVLALGGSPSGVVEAPLAVVRSFDELGPQVAGKIVLFDFPMGDGVPAVAEYADAVRGRAQGAIEAAKHGAVGALVRSVTARSLYTPHTGMMRVPDDGAVVPAVAVTVEDAGWIGRIHDRGEGLILRLQVESGPQGEAQSHNVLAEVRGAVHPDEIVLIGAHLDSWDVGQGAHDDGAGVVQVIEALRLIRALGAPPDRTIRAVLFTNEENGLMGGRTYAEVHGGETHVVAIESDLGAGRPLSWSAAGPDDEVAWLGQVIAPLGLPILEEGGGADIYPLFEAGVLVMGLRPDDSHYFDVHHTMADTIDKVDPGALQEGVAALAGVAWLLANAERDEAAQAPPGR